MTLESRLREIRDSVTTKTLVEIDDSTIINPNEITSMECVVGYASNYWTGKVGKTGTVISFNNGRKVFVESKTPNELLKILSGASE